MALSRPQRLTAWVGLLALAAMLIRPPWFWAGEPDAGICSRQYAAGYAWLWTPPPSPADCVWTTVIWWDQLLEQWVVAGVGMVLLLFVREAQDRAKRDRSATGM